MSDPVDARDMPLLSYMEERRETLLLELREREAKLTEVNHLIDVARDGRSRVNRQRKARTSGNSTAADGERLGNTVPSQFKPLADPAPWLAADTQ